MCFANNQTYCGNNYPSYGWYPVQYPTTNTTSNYAIILVLFILLVIVIGSRFTK